MSYLVPAYFRDVEGRSDWPFLEPVCRRLLEWLLRDARQPIEIQRPALAIGVGGREIGAQQALARQHSREFHIAFLHADGAGDPDRARRERIAPVAGVLPPDANARIVGVVPVHETEAWMLCDGRALRDALGTNLDDRRLEVPATPGEIEGLADPKARLEAICTAARGGRRRRRRGGPPRALLGELVSLEALMCLPAFAFLETELRKALCELGFLPA